ncbi:MAG: sulfide/dihydroorotate dehydrogenase-like FAD/NAD-binding protein [Candidatus Coatesbacteria bacterium]|nr:MAG: sulfide/dihydroorotate dehydrogenase-like FAD/NAD-binding protein [Candidatus Coatesbacteria bacterium]
MYKIVEKDQIAPNTHLVTVEAPLVVHRARPGQFVIVMVDERSERIPYTLSGWNKEDGTITFVFNEVGRSTRKLVDCREGDSIYSVVGPLGVPLETGKVGTVVCAGGCYGIGAIVPAARAFREAGNRVISIIEARTAYLLYMEKENEDACDELIVATGDGSRGMKGFAPEAIRMLLERGEQIDEVVAMGCTFMAKTVSDATRDKQIKTIVSLSPIMVDGTGMCGCCRLDVGGETKFACVDGPFFDGHKVDWGVLSARGAAYFKQERDSIEYSYAGVRR